MMTIPITENNKCLVVKGDTLTSNLFNGELWKVDEKDGELGVYDRWKFIKLSAFFSAYHPRFIIKVVVNEPPWLK